jgi:LPXTG-site transpeptidase (sortase) family protein
VSPRNQAEALAVLVEARGLVGALEPSTPFVTDSGRRRAARCRQELLSALRDGLISAEDLPDAVEVLRCGFHQQLGPCSQIDPYAGRAPGHDHVLSGPWSPLLLPEGHARISTPEAPDWDTAAVETACAVSQPAIGAPLSRPSVQLLSVLPFPPGPPPPRVPLLPPPDLVHAPSVPASASAAQASSAAQESVVEEQLGAPLEISTTEPSVSDVRPSAVRATLLVTGLRVVGVELVLFLLFALFGTAALEGHAQHGLGSSRTALHLSAPAIGLDLVVVNGDGGGELSRGPGLLPTSGQPDTGRPIVIVGSRTTNGAPFRHLAALHPDDDISLRVGTNTESFEVVQVTTVPVHARVTAPAGAQRLYLVTANPPYRDGDRLLVVATAIPPAPADAAGQAATVVLPALAGSSTALLLALGLLGLIACGWSIRSHFRPVRSRRAQLASWLPAIVGSYLFWRLLLDSFSRLL